MHRTLISKLRLAESFKADYLEYNRVLPLEVAGETLKVAIAGDPAPEVLDDLEISFGLKLETVSVSTDELIEGIRRAFTEAEAVVEVLDPYETGNSNHFPPSAVLADVRDLASQPPVIRWVSLMIRDAAESRASDVHLEETREGLRTRLRIDGVLTEVASPPKALQAAVLSRVKLLGDLDIAERRTPQDGRIRLRLEERELDVRVATVPTLYGESVVLRLLDRGGRPVSLDELGMRADLVDQFRRLALRPHGILLATGPTGGGKTTTLYAALGLRDGAAEKVVTVEDPVEYHLEGVTQIPVQRKAGMTFATALRSILRQDPDVLMVGEMRDSETADIAMQAAMTGHLVFSTLHTNDAVSAITRLIDLKVEPYLVSGTLEAVLAQRLVRKVCPECRATYRPDPEVVALLAQQPVGSMSLMRGRGCTGCRQTGYRGRTGIFELLIVTDELKQGIARAEAPTKLREIAREGGMRTLLEDGWIKAQAGITTVEEVLRVTEH